MQQIIKQGLNNSINYSDYKRLMKRLVLDNFTTGDVISEANINYTMLNEKRMDRWDKKLQIPKDAATKIKDYSTKVIWLVITESWCGDAAHMLPVMNKIAELNDNINLRMVLRDDNEDLMNLFLTNGNKSIPKLIMIDAASMEVISTYGPRPNRVTKLVNDYKEQHGQLTPEFKKDLQVWYNNDKGESTLQDLTEMLCKLQPSFCL